MPHRRLAESIGVSVALLSRFERGFAEPTVEQYQLLAEALHCPAKELKAAQRKHMQRATPGEGYTTVSANEMLGHPRQLDPPSDRWRV